MLTVRKASERGHANHGWLDTHYTFSFADYHDPRFMGFGALRVINDDTVAPGGGFPPHSHRDMEIITYVLEGSLQHKDSMGNGSVVTAGEVQRMSAGTGVTHSEFNASREQPLHLLQIWILPRHSGFDPGYEQKQFADHEKRGRLCLIASPEGGQGSLRIAQEAQVFAAQLTAGDPVRYRFAHGRQGWLHVARGAAQLNGILLGAGDGVAITDEGEIMLRSPDSGEVLLFDLGT